MTVEKLDIAIVGAGPAGLACGIEAKRLDYNYLLIEKGCLVNSIYRYPKDMTFFTTADLLEIGDIPMISPFEKPKRIDGLNYYRKVTEVYDLPIRDYTRVVQIEGCKDDFRLLARSEKEGGPQKEEMILARRVILALGYYDNPNFLGIPGESFPKVSHYFTEVHPYFRKKVAVIGGNNSAAEAALLLYRGGADVTLIHRREVLSKEIKYWVRPDIENRIKNKEVRALFNTVVTRIEPDHVWVKNGDEEQPRENDFVLALTGYHPDADFLRRIGIQVDPITYRPQYDPATLESNIPGIYLAGGMITGKETNKIFIENGRFHGAQIFNLPGFWN